MISSLEKLDRIIKALLIPYSGLLSVVFGVMILSIPIGLYVMYNSDVGKELNYQYPINGLDMFLGDIGYKVPISFEMGDAFVVTWTIFLILFTISYFGPENSLLKTLSNMMSREVKRFQGNAMVNMMAWFSILILFSVTIDAVQQSFGVTIESPASSNDLVRFFQLGISPLTEETGFRVLLIGVPLFLMYSPSASWKTLIKSLWRPSKYLSISDYRKPMILIITIGLLFGVAHIISGTPWSPGKVTQAAMAGIIIGWVYVRYGLAPAILVHWATNYFLFSYLFFLSNLSQSSTINDSSNPFSNTLEVILVTTGLFALVIKILEHIESKKIASSQSI
ncbi:MAG TPA: CPBP family intramembrane glutamic endopeptidase [Candidatus Nitrosotalea sp.]|nr:CPBP family intramembrane glutamic endopeptidase [Candidatus Nitrosotalea sp.]